MILLDTDVCIDVLRGYPPAVSWLDSLPDVPSLPGFVVLELIEGCRNRAEARQLRRILRPFPIVWPRQSDLERTVATYTEGHLAAGLGLLDAVIGECAVGLNGVLATFNLRHYAAVPRLTTVQPYSR